MLLEWFWRHRKNDAKKGFATLLINSRNFTNWQGCPILCSGLWLSLVIRSLGPWSLALGFRCTLFFVHESCMANLSWSLIGSWYGALGSWVVEIPWLAWLWHHHGRTHACVLSFAATACYHSPDARTMDREPMPMASRPRTKDT